MLFLGQPCNSLTILRPFLQDTMFPLTAQVISPVVKLECRTTLRFLFIPWQEIRWQRSVNMKEQ